jgi:hypothetical protein
MKKYFVVYSLLVMLLFTAGCEPQQDEIITFLDNQYEILKPASWRMLTDLNDEADLQMGNPFDTAYFIILSENRADFEDTLTVGQHAHESVTTLVSAVKDAKITSGPVDITVNGMEGVQYEITGMIENVKINYLHTTLQSKKHFHQIVAWSLPSNFAKNKKDYDRVINSIKEVM